MEANSGVLGKRLPLISAGIFLGFGIRRLCRWYWDLGFLVLGALLVLVGGMMLQRGNGEISE